MSDNKVETEPLAGRKLRASLKRQRQNHVQDEVLNAATALFAKNGFRAVSMDQIAAEIGFGKSSIYYYFQNKGDLLWRIFEFILNNYLERAKEILKERASPTERMRLLIRNHILVLLGHQDWTTVFFRDLSELADDNRKEISKRMREYNGIFEKVYRDGVERKLFRDIPSRVAVNGILGSCNWLTHWFVQKNESDAELIADQLTSLLANGYQTAG